MYRAEKLLEGLDIKLHKRLPAAHAARQITLYLQSSAPSVRVQHSGLLDMILGKTPSPCASTLPSTATHILTLNNSCTVTLPSSPTNCGVSGVYWSALFALEFWSQALSWPATRLSDRSCSYRTAMSVSCTWLMVFINSWWGCSSILRDVA